jgi:hypothetical protein
MLAPMSPINNVGEPSLPLCIQPMGGARSAMMQLPGLLWLMACTRYMDEQAQ